MPNIWMHEYILMFPFLIPLSDRCLTYKTPNVSKRSLKNTVILQTGNMGGQRPRKMSLNVCHMKLGESAVS